MDKLLFPNGGMPLYGDDFAFMQSNLMTGINVCLRPYAALNGGNMVVSGCDLTFNSTYIIGAGWVMIDYELRYFAGGDSGVADAADLYDIEIEAYDYPSSNSNATRNLVNNTSANVWQIRSARFRQTPNVATLQVANKATHLSYLAAKFIEGAADVVVTLTDFENNWTGGNLFSPKATRRGNTVILSGLLGVGAIESIVFTQAFTIQSGFRAKRRQYFVCAMPNSSIALVDILTTGEVFVKYLLADTNNLPSLLDISNIRYEAA